MGTHSGIVFNSEIIQSNAYFIKLNKRLNSSVNLLECTKDEFTWSYKSNAMLCELVALERRMAYVVYIQVCPKIILNQSVFNKKIPFHS